VVLAVEGVAPAGAPVSRTAIGRQGRRPLQVGDLEHRAGAAKGEALREAQLHLLGGAVGANARAPFHWAAFEL
jgi:hypothetical protein